MRVKKAVTGGATTVYIFSGSKVVAEYDNGAAPSSPSREFIYSGGALLAKIDGSGTKYYHQDHLSNRMVTDSSGNVAAQMGHFPFGESWYNTTSDKLQFTTYERDAETGNDYAQARSHVNRLGRFSSLDPVAGSIGDPQTLNRYTYVRNMPTMLVDPAGMDESSPCSLVGSKPRQKKDPESATNALHSPADLSDDADLDAEPPQLPCVAEPPDGGSGPGGDNTPGAVLDDSVPLPDSVEMTVFLPSQPTYVNASYLPVPDLIDPNLNLGPVDFGQGTHGNGGSFGGRGSGSGRGGAPTQSFADCVKRLSNAGSVQTALGLQNSAVAGVFLGNNFASAIQLGQSIGVSASGTANGMVQTFGSNAATAAAGAAAKQLPTIVATASVTVTTASVTASSLTLQQTSASVILSLPLSRVAGAVVNGISGALNVKTYFDAGITALAAYYCKKDGY